MSSEATEPEKKKEVDRADADIQVDMVKIDDVIIPIEQIRSKVVEIKHRMNEDFWELSKLLYHVWDKELWKRWGWSDFKDYVEKELDFKGRKAHYLIRIWIFFGEGILSARPDLKELMQKVGWTKLKELEGNIEAQNVEEWLKKALGMSTPELQEKLKEKKAAAGGDGGEKGDGKEKFAKKNFSLAPEQDKNVDEAFKLAGKMAKSDKQGHLLDLICTSFIATNAEASTKRGIGILSSIEAQHGVLIIAADKKTQDIVHGRETFERMKKAIEDAIIGPAKEAEKPAENPGDGAESNE